MRTRRWLPVLAGLLTLLSGPGPVLAQSASGTRLFTLSDPRIGEASGVAAVPLAAADPAAVRMLARVTNLSLGFTGMPGGPNLVGQLTVTGASIAPDGSLLAVRTYTVAYLWPITGGDVPAALRDAPTRVPLPAQPQGEGVAVTADGSLLIVSEGVGSAVYRVPVPATVRRPHPGGAAGSFGPSRPPASPSATAAASGPATERRLVSTTGSEWLPVAALVLLFLLVAGLVLVAVRRARSARRRD